MNYMSIWETKAPYTFNRTGMAREELNYSNTTCSPKLLLTSQRHTNSVQSMLPTTVQSIYLKFCNFILNHSDIICFRSQSSPDRDTYRKYYISILEDGNEEKKNYVK